MRRTFFSTIFSIIGLSVVSFLIYRKCTSSNSIPVWNIIPSDALVVIEASNGFNAWQTINQTAFGKTLFSISDFKNIKQNIQFLDSLSEEHGQLNSILKDKLIVASLHTIGTDDFGFLFFIPINGKSEDEFIQQILNEVQQSNDFITETRLYEGFSFIEITSIRTRHQLTCFRYQNYFIASYYSSLVESVVERLHSTDDKPTTDYKSIGLSTAQQDEVKIYIRLGETNRLLEAFFNSSVSFDAFFPFANTSSLSGTISNSYAALAGFSSTTSSTFLSLFKNQQPQSFDLKNYISNRTALTCFLGFNQPVVWKDSLLTYWDQKGYKLKDNWKKIKTEYRFHVDDWLNTLSGKIAYSLWGISSSSPSARFLYIQVEQSEETKNKLKPISTELSASINQLSIPNFPTCVWGNLFSGFENTYYTFVEDQIIFSDNLNALKLLISDIANENTWGKSVQSNRFLESVLKESNVSLFISTSPFLSLIEHQGSTKWKKFFTKNSPWLNLFPYASLQFSYSDDTFYTTLTLSHSLSKYERIDSPSSTSQEPPLQDKKEPTTSLVTTPFIHKPIGVRGFGDSQLRFLLQDQDYRLYLCSKQGKKIWEKKLGSPIVTDIVKLTFKEKGSTLCAFATTNRLHLIDEYGKYSDHFPILISSTEPIDHLSVMDYDSDGLYRLAITLQSGDIYIYDLKGNLLKEWSPRFIKERSISPIQHARVAAKDYLITISQKGSVYLFNRKGKLYDQFPINLKTKIPFYSFFIEKKDNLKSSIINLLTEGGEFIQLDFQGNSIKRKQLENTTKKSSFKLIKDSKNQTWIIARLEQKGITFLSQRATVLFNYNTDKPSHQLIQYYVFGKDELIIITDKDTKKTHLFTSKGKPLYSSTINSDFEIAITKGDGKGTYQIYTCHDNHFQITAIP